MRKRLFATFLAVIAATAMAPVTDACTNIIVTRGASADGSNMVTYAADSHQLYGECYFSPAADWAPGSMIDIYDWDGGMYRGKIAQVPHTFKTVGNMNEFQLTITETTYGGRPGLENEDGIMDYGSLIYITLQRAKTAREAIYTIDALAQMYGYPSEGESFSIADKNEAWIMELIGKGEERGIVWVARRVPDGYISGHANQSRIHTFPLNDPENCLYSPDVISFARKKGFFSGKDSEFSFCDAYAPADFGALRGCEARVWAAFNILCDGQFTWEDEGGIHSSESKEWLDFAMGYNSEHKMPLFVKPARKVSLRALSDVMRDHYENTPMDMTQDVGAGACSTPYRWRPMGFEVDGKNYIHERAIATQQTGFWILCQSRPWLPDEIGGILWFGVDDAATSALTPIYTNVESISDHIRVGNGSMIEYSPTSAFWQNNKVTHFAYLFYDRVAPVIRKEIEKHENGCIARVAEDDAKALAMIQGGNRSQALAFLTEESKAMTSQLFNRWKELENELLVKYMDGNVKKQDEEGNYLLQTPGTAIPASPAHPANRERWIRSIVKDNGETLQER